MRTRSVALVAATLSLLGAPSTRGQQKPEFAASAELVVLHVTVRDRNGAYVEGLTRDAFHIVEDGRPQDVTQFTDTDTPATVGLLIDSSGSMFERKALTVAGASAFADASHREDEIFALAFNARVTPVLPAGAPFTSDAALLRGALERGIDAYGSTRLYDAIVAGVDYLALGRRDRKVLVLLSDGGDNASRATKEAAIQKAQASNAVIYTVAVIERGAGANPALLEELSLESGGESYRPRNARAIADVLGRIARDIRHTYTIGYAPTNTARDGAFRRVRVDVNGGPGRPLVVRSRTGYRAGLN